MNIPKNTNFALPEKINIIDRPDFISRKTSKYLGKSWYDTQKEYNGITGENLQILRNRLETYEIPCNHGLAQWQYGSRFEKTHPEYFALMPDGRRYHSPTLPMTTHLCFSSGLKEQIYQAVWKEEPENVKNAVSCVIAKIRQKLRKYTKKEYIQTVRGIGYKFVDVPERQSYG